MSPFLTAVVVFLVGSALSWLVHRHSRQRFDAGYQLGLQHSIEAVQSERNWTRSNRTKVALQNVVAEISSFQTGDA